MVVPTYEQRLIMKNAEERPTYFMCGKRSLPALMDKARAEADQLLKELQMFYTFGGKVEIEIFPVYHELCYSVGAKLTFDGALVRAEDTCDLLFLTLNNLMLNRMLKSGMISFAKGGETA